MPAPRNSTLQRAKAQRSGDSPSVPVSRSPSLSLRAVSPSLRRPVQLSVEELQQTPDSRLLSYLMDVYDSVRSVSIRPLLSGMTSSPSLALAAAAAAPAPRPVRPTNPFTPEYVEELLTPRLLFSVIPDVSQLVACLLCDALRLHHQQHEDLLQRSALQDEESGGSGTPTNASGSTAPPPPPSPRSVAESQHTMEADVAAGVAPLPFASSRCAEVLRCITRCFEQLTHPVSGASAAAAAPLPLKKVAYLVERAAVSHVFRYLLPHCALADEETQRGLQHVFDAVRCASLAPDSNTTTAAAATAAAASVSTCSEMAQLLIDILAATGDVTSAQLTPLMAELARGSTARRQEAAKKKKALASGQERAAVPGGRGSQSTTVQLRAGVSAGSSSGGALIAQRVLLEQGEMMLQPAIAAWALGEFDDGVAELLAADVLEGEAREGEEDEDAAAAAAAALDAMVNAADGATPHTMTKGLEGQQQQLSRRRSGLRRVAHVLEVVVALVELSAHLADRVLPELSTHLEHQNADLRLLLVRGFGAVFAANEAAITTYSSLFTGPFLSRFIDVKPNIRIECLRVSAMLLQHYQTEGDGAHKAATTSGEDAGNRAELHHPQRRLWTALQPCWSRLLTDAHVLVRKQAVTSVTEAALAAPALFASCHHDSSPPLPSQRRSGPAVGTNTASGFLAQTLGLRSRDKNKRVREAAVEGLTALYSAYRLPWIPNAVLDAPRVEASSGSAVLVERVLEALLPSPAAPATTASALASTQATLTQWMGGGHSAQSTTAAAGSTAGGSAAKTFALFDFERADYVDPARHPNGEQSTAEADNGDALLGFTSATAAPTAAAAAAPPSSSCVSSPNAAAAAVYVDGLIQLCQSLDAAHFTQLLRAAEKKPQLRLAVVRLFEFHAAVRSSNGDVKSAEGQQRIHAIHRLLTFLQETTGAVKGEWEALFRAKDEVVRKALLRACAPTAEHPNTAAAVAARLDWVEARDTLLRTLQGRISPDVFSYVKHTLVPQLLLPTHTDHVVELMRRLRRSIYAGDHAEGPAKASETVGVLRGLLLLTAGAPAYCTLSPAGLAEAVEAVARQSAGPPPVWCAVLLQALQQWASAARADHEPSASQGTTGGHGGADSAQGKPLASPAQCEALVRALQDMALAALPIQQTRAAAPPTKTKNASAGPQPAVTASPTQPDSPLRLLKQLAKQATRTLLALLQVRGFEGSAAAALKAVVSTLTHELTASQALTSDVKTVAWLASLQALAVHPRASAALHAPAEAVTKAECVKGKGVKGEAAVPMLLPHLRALMLSAVADVSDKSELVKLPRPVPAATSTATAPASAQEAEADGSVSLTLSSQQQQQQQSLLSCCSVAAAIVDGTAKVMTRIALSCPASAPSSTGSTATRSAAVSYALESLLQAYKATAALPCGRAGSASIASCQRRLAIEKQLVKLLATPTADLAKELAASVVLSVEQEAQVREAVQGKLAALLVHRSCDMRVAALLLLTALSEDNKASYSRLRGVVEAVGDHLRGKQASQGVSLSSPAALYCYWEYTIPFLVLFLAHHPYYPSEEAETQFVGFQRVWHLLVGELFRHGTQCAGFVVELLSKIKQSDDALDPSSDASRVVCDLGSRVLLECLGQRQSRAEDLRRYPGAILLPSFFVKSAMQSPQKLLERSFLSDKVRVAANPPFRVLAAASTGSTATWGGVGSRGSSRQGTPRASSLASGERHVSAEAEEKNDAAVESRRATPYGEALPHQRDAAQQQQRVPSTQRKRYRAASESPEADVYISSPAVSLSPSVTPQDRNTQEARTGSSEPSSQRARTEPAVADSAETPLSSSYLSNSSSGGGGMYGSGGADKHAALKREARQRAAVDAALAALFTNLTKAEIAQLRWKVVRARLEEALHDAEAAGEKPVEQQQVHGSAVGATEANMEVLLQYAKDQLRVWYARAPS